MTAYPRSGAAPECLWGLWWRRCQLFPTVIPRQTSNPLRSIHVKLLFILLICGYCPRAALSNDSSFGPNCASRSNLGSAYDRKLLGRHASADSASQNTPLPTQPGMDCEKLHVMAGLEHSEGAWKLRIRPGTCMLSTPVGHGRRVAPL